MEIVKFKWLSNFKISLKYYSDVAEIAEIDAHNLLVFKNYLGLKNTEERDSSLTSLFYVLLQNILKYLELEMKCFQVIKYVYLFFTKELQAPIIDVFLPKEED